MEVSQAHTGLLAQAVRPWSFPPTPDAQMPANLLQNMHKSANV
jgi:hypothetical protein